LKPPLTLDGRYIVVDGRLWRAANPHLSPDVRQALVNRLMDARRAVKAALASGDAEQLAGARAEVQASKEALGERGAPWWRDGAPDLGRRPIAATPYAEWWLSRGKSDETHGARAETRPRQ
jgi:hypothetical protein